MRACENPFRSACVEGLDYEFERGGWVDLIERVEACGYRCAVVGGHGSGKTTLMAGLAARLRERGIGVRVVRAESDDAIGIAGLIEIVWGCRSDEVLVLDAAGLVSGIGWRVLRLASRRLSGLIISSHTEVGGLKTVLKTGSSPVCVSGMVDRLSGLEAVVSMHDCDEMLKRHLGNVRLVFRELYDRCASM